MSSFILQMSRLAAAVTATCAITGPAFTQNLIVNGGFEASSDGFTTPPGWTNIGPTNGVVPYSAVAVFNLAAYEGVNFYSLGGPGTNGLSSVGVGIGQSVATTAGNTYRLTFGYSGENGPGLSTVLGVAIGGSLSQYALVSTPDGFFGRPFTTATIDYVATAALTAINFTLLATNERGLIGNADPIIDGVVFEQIAVAGVPEPATWGLMIAGFAAIGAASRRRRIASWARHAY